MLSYRMAHVESSMSPTEGVNIEECLPGIWPMEFHTKISWYAEALRVSFTVTKRPSSWKTSPHHNHHPSTQLYTWNNAIRKVPFSWQRTNPDFRQSDWWRWRSVFRHSRKHISTNLDSNGSMLYSSGPQPLPTDWYWARGFFHWKQSTNKAFSPLGRCEATWHKTVNQQLRKTFRTRLRNARKW